MTHGVLGMVTVVGALALFGACSSDKATSSGGSGTGTPACSTDACSATQACCEAFYCKDDKCELCAQKGESCGDPLAPCCAGFTCGQDSAGDTCCLAAGQTSCKDTGGGTGSCADFKAKCASTCKCKASTTTCQSLTDHWGEAECKTALTTFNCGDGTYCAACTSDDGCGADEHCDPDAHYCVAGAPQ
jgi:hypothetical protein